MKRVLLSIFIICSALACNASPSELSRQATAFYSDNNPVRTMDLILQINEKERSAQDWLLLGNVLADENKAEDAVYMYQKAILADRRNYKPYYNLGNYYMEKGNIDDAISYYKKAIQYKFDNPYIYYNLANAYIAKEDYKHARSALNKAIMYKSNVPEFHYNLAYVYKQLHKEKLAQTYVKNYNNLLRPY